MISRTISRRSFLETAAVGAMAAGLTGNLMKGKMAFADDNPLYKPAWESLDSHPCPEWFKDAKLGMYFHWGVESVSEWAPRSEGLSYAEWYWINMMNKKSATYKYHRETYGENFTYDDFIPMFKAERYDPEEWVQFAKSAGMKYIFVNSKHHDGFCLWPTKLTNRNAYAMGPKRDLIGPLVDAARRENLKMGFYYSFYEWFNPLYTGKPMPYAGLIHHDDFVDDFMVPQIKELIEMYHPDFLYFDGEWDHPPEFWKSREVVAHYYNQALKRGQNVLVNDRYGKGNRGHHGDVFNVEYNYGDKSKNLLSHKWSYWQGLGKTFGYNKDQNPEDCLSVKDLIHMVVDCVSNNGNFDINVGPTASGIISDVEKDLLIALGKWLRVNGEVIYGTRPWIVPAEEDIRLTAKGDYVYAIFLKWHGEKFHIKSVRAIKGSKITMLGVPGDLNWHQDAYGITIEYPLHKSRPSQCAYAYVFKIKVKE